MYTFLLKSLSFRQALSSLDRKLFGAFLLIVHKIALRKALENGHFPILLQKGSVFVYRRSRLFACWPPHLSPPPLPPPPPPQFSMLPLFLLRSLFMRFLTFSDFFVLKETHSLSIQSKDTAKKFFFPFPFPSDTFIVRRHWLTLGNKTEIELLSFFFPVISMVCS